ncbi:S8 family peptidase [Mucilaginibacter puniceus]
MKKLLLFKKLILVAGICIPNFLFAQANPKPNWQNGDLKTDTVFGISIEKTYNELLKNKKHVPVLVAVIDGGVDIDHEDLKSVIWTNPGDKTANKVDNDKNGYVDDIHGWDFIGGAKGDVHHDNLELTRLVRMYKKQFANLDTNALTGQQLADFTTYHKLRNELNDEIKEAQAGYNNINGFKIALDGLLAGMNKTNPTLEEIRAYEPKSQNDTRAKRILLNNLPKYKDLNEFVDQQVTAGLEHYKSQLEYHYNINYDPRDIVGDNYTNSNERFYGNNDVTGPDADHGSHVSGIIGADRTNNLGITGIANDVKIMSVRTVPDGDERDKDVANAIRYAAANGAKVINMSFGKAYSYNKKVVDDAVKFAMSKDVLIVHAAGNDNKNTTVENNFPTRIYEDKSGEAKAWIEVGASGPTDDKTLKASFSNYGKTSVDVFAPGVAIYSTTPGSKYANHSGTSMAAPVVAGLAAVIRSYYPKLTAVQVKDIIMKSVIKITHPISLEIDDKDTDLAFDELCVTGGVVNAYNALQLAATYK